MGPKTQNVECFPVMEMVQWPGSGLWKSPLVKRQAGDYCSHNQQPQIASEWREGGGTNETTLMMLKGVTGRTFVHSTSRYAVQCMYPRVDKQC